MLLPTMFHWAPTERRVAILQQGLIPYAPPVVHTGSHAFPYICLSPTPSSGWGLSGDMEWASEIESWDLWQVRLQEGDEISIRGDFGPVVREVRVRNAISADRLWYIATREPLCAIGGDDGH